MSEDSNTWFQISNQGFRAKHLGRSLGHLIREAVSNVFDADDATVCSVVLSEGGVIIVDDAPTGIVDKSLVTTVYLTNKHDSPTKRGRKGLGLKELIAAGDSATVMTVGYSVIFNEDGTRSIVEGQGTDGGTTVMVKNREWIDTNALHEAEQYLRRFIPPSNIGMSVNGHAVETAKIRETIEAELDTTVIDDGVQRNRLCRTQILIRNLRKGETQGWVFEMGVPVQLSETKFHIDVQQRIPMNDNRDVVDSSFLPKLYAVVLRGMIRKLPKKELSQKWVNSGIYEADGVTSQEYASRIVPRGSVIKSDDRHANDRAKQAGAELIDISMLPWEAKYKIERYSTDAVAFAKHLDESAVAVDRDDIRSNYSNFVDLMEWVALKLTDDHYTITFMEKPAAFNGTQTCADHDGSRRRIRFNTLAGEIDFRKPISEVALSVMVHELAHKSFSEHDAGFHEEVERLSGKLAVLMFTDKSEIEAIMGGTMAAAVAASGKTHPVACQWDGCDEIRMVKPQDLHQTRFCKVHQSEHTKAAAKKRARIKRAKQYRDEE